MVDTLRLEPDVVRLPRRERRRVVATTVTARGEVLRLCVGEAVASRVLGRRGRAGGASFPKTKAEGYEALLTVVRPSETREVRLRGLTATFPLVELLGDGSVLVVAPRCSRNRGRAERNGRIYDATGQLVSELLLGDGIEHVQVDERDRIWVGYFDEGVYGNLGWGGDGAMPVGAPGLVCFDRRGKKLWEFEPPEGLGPIDDCYALAVGQSSVWAYYYSDFPIVRVDAETLQVTAWRTPGDGGSAFATDGARVLLYGGYGPERNRCRLLELDDDSATLRAEVSLGSSDRVTTVTAIGRGDQLHVFAGDEWFRYSLTAL